MPRTRARLLQVLCGVLVVAGLSGSAVRLQEPVQAALPGLESSVSGADPTPGPALSDSTGGPAAAAEQPANAAGPDATGAQASGPAESTTSNDSTTDGPVSEALGKGVPVVASKEAGPVGPPGPWRLVLDEEFNSLNTSLWTPYWFRDCHPGSRKNKVKTCSSNVKVENGNAVLQLSDADSGALLSSNPKDGVPGHMGFQYSTGYVEARIYFPGTCASGVYNWPAWWTTGQKFPATGEIDIAEPLEGTMTTVYHSPGSDPAKYFIGCWAGAYHTYGVNRKPGVNDVYFDGKLEYSYATNDGNAPHYLLLNVGIWSDKKTLGEAGAVSVDWVRAWQ
ncbi:family 16 glycosylhydrolase [Pseudarthrobacter sp. NIBRBAC000502771]|uniref:glycoside hydrolase family 16 protein n=1 Tax=Pseudarthrobacter sp. NIBRBAC000502771 TaxID=2590774 RepID=UPI001131A805|nr:family 16 glycosylhydrolase [Pseudarthrobacter sp. NIBRBAC000502771]QDG62322.1 glycosyl hydrolase family protein [Pseudarthrobacter sp. NIBRBAC000502771]